MNAFQDGHEARLKDRLYTMAIRAGDLSNTLFSLRREVHRIEELPVRVRLQSSVAMLRAWADELEVLAAGGVP